MGNCEELDTLDGLQRELPKAFLTESICTYDSPDPLTRTTSRAYQNC